MVTTTYTPKKIKDGDKIKTLSIARYCSEEELKDRKVQFNHFQEESEMKVQESGKNQTNRNS